MRSGFWQASKDDGSDGNVVRVDASNNGRSLTRNRPREAFLRVARQNRPSEAIVAVEPGDYVPQAVGYAKLEVSVSLTMQQSPVKPQPRRYRSWTIARV